LLASLFALASASAAQASPPAATWTGGSSGRTLEAVEWSVGSNWEGGVAPNASEGVGTLTFPHLTNPTCAAEKPEDACYLSFNNFPSLSVESIKLDDTDEYAILGEPIHLGSGGLVASPAGGTSGEGGDVVEAPIDLAASQNWSIAGRSGGGIAENGAIFAGAISGSGDSLGVEVSNGPLFLLARNDTEVGPVTIHGGDTSVIAENGLVSLIGAKLNASDGEPVSLSHIFFAGSGVLGPLTTTATDLDVGAAGENLEAQSAKLGSGIALFNVTGAGTSAPGDYSQLTSHGAVELGGAHFELLVSAAKLGASCPTLAPGATYTFISTTGTLSGQFANAPEGGAEVPIRFAEECGHRSQTIKISYHESGGTETVTGTVEEARRHHEEEEAAARRHHEEEEAAARRRDEEEAAAATARRRRAEEEAAARGRSGEPPTGPTGGVLGTTENSIGAAQIKASLLHQLTPSGKGAKIASLVNEGGFTLRFKALEAGSATIQWYEVPPGAILSKKSKAKPVLVASGRATFAAAATEKLKIKLTSAGKTMLKRARTLKLTAKGSFTPAGKNAVVVTKAFVLRR
jgi:hypothetical protein